MKSKLNVHYALSLIFFPIFAFALEGMPYTPNFENAPRPTLIPEQVIDLTGNKWDFAIGDDENRQPGIMNKARFPYKINFGFAPESELSGIDHYESLRDQKSSRDIIWYKKDIILPLDWKGAVLTFEGVDYDAEVYINGHYAFSHQGAYAPFEADITPFLKKGSPVAGGIKHTITMRAEDDRLIRDRAVGKQERRLHEGVIFYGNSSGAWKGAYLRKINPELYIADLKFRTNSKGLFSYEVKLGGSLQKDLTAKVTLIDRESKQMTVGSASIINHKMMSELVVEGAKTWSPDSPNLYDIEVQLFKQGEMIETIKSYTGFSDFTQKNGHFLLNGKPFYLRGVLNQMVFPKGLYTPGPGDNALDLKLIREHGFNFQRVHQTTPRWRDIYEMENGVVIKDSKTKKMKRLGVAWALEMPSARDVRKPKALMQFLKEWTEIVSAYGWGHPGLLYYVAGNEDWGMLEDPDHWAPASDADRAQFQLTLLRSTLEVAPPGALVSPNDGWRQITGMKNGEVLPGINPSQIILSSHDYKGTRQELIRHYQDVPVNASAGTPLPDSGKELLLKGYEFPGKDVAPMLGEFGGKSYAPPGIGNVFGYGHVYREISAWTHDALEQFKALSVIKIFRGGYVYTQVRDAGFKPHLPLPPDRPAGELNGLMSADGIPKSAPAAWMEINLKNQQAFENNLREYETTEGRVSP